MPSLTDLIQQGAGHPWLYLPIALVLGALHGLEPGHSKTMMAAFIIAIRGTIMQAALLGLCAAFSHSLLIWILAAFALHYGSHWNAAATEPTLQLISGLLVIAMAFWMIWRTRRSQAPHSHDHDHHHDHHHDHEHPHDHSHSHEAPATFPQPSLAAVYEGEHLDAHARAHALDIKKRFAGREVTTPQIVLFGLTGGLMPCPGALTVLILCLQLKQLFLGTALVLCFSAGLALTLVLAGVLAAWGARHATKRFHGLGEFAERAPYFSGILLIAIGLYLAIEGWTHL